MSITFKYPISTTANVSGTTVFSPITNGSYYLRKDPYTVNTYTGTFGANCLWDFGTIEDGDYELWTATSKVDGFGRRYLGDRSPTFISVDVSGNVSITGDLTATGQTNFYNSVNFNSQDVAHIDNLQVHSLSENNSGSGVTFSHKIVLSDAVRIASNLVSLSSNNVFPNNVRNQYSLNPEFIGTATTPSLSGFVWRSAADAMYGRLNSNNIWNANNNFANYPLYTGSTLIDPTSFQFITRDFANRLILSANLGSVTSTYISQVSNNVVRLLPNGVNNTTTKVATTWALAMKQAKDSITASPSSATKQMIVHLEGIGESGTSLPITDTEIGTYFYPKVHIKGMSQHIRLEIPDASMDSGGSATSCLVENTTLYHDDLGLGATPSFANMSFKDCYFDLAIQGINFSNCKFLGTNILKLRTGSLSLNSVTGTAYYTTVTATKTGVTPMEILETYL